MLFLMNELAKKAEINILSAPIQQGRVPGRGIMGSDVWVYKK